MSFENKENKAVMVVCKTFKYEPEKGVYLEYIHEINMCSF